MASNVQPGGRYAVPPELEIERGDLAPPAAAAEASSRLVVVTYTIRYAVGSHLIGGSLLRRVGLGWPGRRPRLVGANIRAAFRMFPPTSRGRRPGQPRPTRRRRLPPMWCEPTA